VTESAESKIDFPFETSIPDDTVSLESILCTEELRRRPFRPPDYEKENRALAALASSLADSESNILQTLAEIILEVTLCDSSGVTLRTKDDDGRRFCWPATAGMWKSHMWSESSRTFGPCGDVLDRNCTLLFQHFERRYPYLLAVMRPAEECLMIPFCVSGKAVGAICAIMHTDRRKFDAEDERLVTALGQFASVAYQTQESIEDLKLQIAAREKAETALRELADGLEAKIRHSEAHLADEHRLTQSIIDSALDAVVAMDADGIITDWNKRAEDMFGWARSEALGRRMSETTIPMRYRLSHEAGLRHFFKTGQGPILNHRIEITALRRDGSEFPVELTVTPLKSSDTWTFSSFIRDISARKRSEEQLRTSELNLRRMTETIPEMLWSATPDGAVDYCNARVLDYTGLSNEEIKGTGWMKRIHPDDADNIARAWTHSVESGDPFQFEFRCLRSSDNMYRWCVSSALPLRAPNGSILKWYGTVIDFHDRRQAQEDLRNAQAELAHVNRVMTMGELTASIAHEVNQPLAAIIASGDSCSAWLASEPPNLDKARAAASRVIQAATQASEIVQRIRALFKKTPSITTSVDMNELIEETISFVHHEAQRKNVSLRADLGAGLPTIGGDRVQLEQVILNLMMNAIESMASLDRQPKQILIRSALKNPGELLVSVADTGPGIDAEHANRLFAPFFTTKPEGIGMGLAICRSIIEAHGGRLWAENNESGGAVFHFMLPINAPSQ
jgi:PAS domain S-box-containing protein